MNRRYLGFRRTIDGWLTKRRAGSSWILLPTLPAILAILLFQAGLGAPLVGRIAIAITVVSLLALQIFVIWRGIRLQKTNAYKMGRYFERVGRYDLAKEYWDSEDSALAAYRRKRAKLNPPPLPVVP